MLTALRVITIGLRLKAKTNGFTKEGGKVKQAVFELYKPETQAGIKEVGYVVITESPVDALVLYAAGFPAIAVLGKGQADALACDLHKQTLLNLLGDAGSIYVWREPDAAKFPQEVANALQQPVKVIYPPDYAKDAHRIWLACKKDWDRFRDEIVGLIQNATEVAPQPEPIYEPKIVRVRQSFEEAVWRPLGEITMPQNDRWQVEGLIKEGNLVILSARPKTSKSIVALNLAACVSMGKPFLDRSVTQGRALFVAYERHNTTLKRALAMGLASCKDFMLWDKVAYRLPRVDMLDGWVGFIERNGVKLIVFDTLVHFLRPELEKVRNAINAYDHVYKVMEMLQSAAVETGCTFVLIHHDRKGETAETDEARVLGTTALTASPDAVFQLKAMSDKVICLKASGNEIEETTLYFKVGEDFWIELVDKPATTKEEKAAREIEGYLRQHGEATRQQLIDLMLEIGLAENKTTASKLVDRAIQDRLVTRVKKEYKGRELVYHWQGGLKTTKTDMGFVYGVYNREATEDIVDNVDIVDNDRLVYGVYNSQPDPQRLTPKTNPISVSNVYNSQPEGDPQEAPPAKEPNPAIIKRVEGGCVVAATEDWVEDDGVVVVASDDIPPDLEPEGSPTLLERPVKEPVGDPLNEEWLWDWLTPESLNLPCAQAQSEVSPPDLPANEPEDSPPDQPVATLNEPTCPICGERLEPEPESGLAACLGCGRLFKVEIPPDSPDDDGDNPPNPQDNGHGGGQGGVAPPEAPSIQPDQVGIYSDKFKPNETLNRITERLPDGSIKLAWDRKTETVAPDDLAGWQPIEEIPEISLPDIETVEIPPVVVIDLETTDKDPQRGSILAAGLALYVEGKEVEVQIFHNEGDEAALLAQTFGWLRETCNNLGGFILTGYNIFDFDLTFMIERADMLGVDCPFDFRKDENGEIVRRRVAATEGTLKGDPLDYPVIVTKDLPIRIVDTQHLVCRWDYTAKQLRSYDLKSVAAHFSVNQPNRPILTPDQIQHAFQHDPATFEAYLLADLRETYALFAKLIPPYAGIAALTGLQLDQVVTRSTAWVWQQILERYYAQIPQPDEKRDYEGGLVVSRKGFWSPCLKIDIASLYPTLMLAYRIHSRKDTAQIALRWLNALRRQRLVLKAKAKAGDTKAQILQEAMKILLNSLYGFYGTGGYGFNDMTAAERVTEIGRKVLTCMIAAIEDAGGIVVEADTDGIIICYRNTDPQKILEAVNAAIPEVFKVEVEWQEAIVFVSDDKNYVVIDAEGKIETVKGSKWRGRDKPAYARKAIPTFLQLWATQGKEAALDYAKQVLSEIRSGQGWDWVVQTHRVGKDDTNFLRAGFKVGERAIFAYKVKRKTQKDSEIAKSPDEGYDIQFYSDKFSDLIEEVIEVIDPAQIEAWREIVSQQARPLFFGAK